MALIHFNDDVMASVARYLRAKDLANLGQTCRRFGRAIDDNDLSFTEDVARQRFESSASETEMISLPQGGRRYARGETTHLALVYELEQLRIPLIFNALLGRGIQYHPSPLNHSRLWIRTRCGHQTAICNHVMKGGKHCVIYEMFENGSTGFLGIIRPIKRWNEKGINSFDPIPADHQLHGNTINQNTINQLHSERTSRWGQSDVHCCTWSTAESICLWSDWNGPTQVDTSLEGQFNFDSCKIAMLLDLDEGTLTVFNLWWPTGDLMWPNRKRAVLKRGLSGEYCWMACTDTAGYDPCDIKIARANRLIPFLSDADRDLTTV